MKKCAFIKSDKDDNKCPFGLPITLGCENAGQSITRMCPLSMVEDNKKEQVKLANSRVYVYYKTGQRCIYAANVMHNMESVNCDFADSGAGMGTPAFNGSPLYPQTFAGGVGIDALYSYPIGLYADNSQSRNLFQGLFSLVGAEEKLQIIKNAIPKNILDKLEENEKLNEDERNELENIIMICKEKYDDNTDTNEKIEKLTEEIGR